MSSDRKPTQRHLATAYLWLFSANVNPDEIDTGGTQLAQSLASLLEQAERDGRREAASHYLSIKKSGEFDAEDTGEYDTNELQSLLRAVK